MKAKLDKQELNNLKKQVRPFILQLKNEKAFIIKDIAEALGKNKDAVDKWAQGVSFPTNKEIKTIVEKLKRLMEKSNVINEPGRNYGIKNSLVSIFFSFDQKAENYTGLRTIGTITKVNDIDAIIAYPNDSIQFEDAEGLIPMLDPGAEPSYKYESLIAIKKINLNSCRSGFQYYIIDNANQSYLRTIYKINEETYKLVAENSKRFPDFELTREEIAAVFKVIISASKPKPNLI